MISQKYKIYLDLDGVVANWAKQFEKISGVPVEYYEQQHGKEKRYQFVHKNSPDFYATMPLTKDASVLLNFLNNLPVEILSHATDAEAEAGKLTWLKNNKITHKPNLVRNREDKAKFANAESILIDDRPDTIQQFNSAGGIGILHTNATDTINKLKEILGVKEKHRLYNSILNPSLFKNDILDTEAVQALLKIANNFYKDTELNAPILDIYMIGSSAGYNWTPTSDIDLHILIDFSQIDENKDLVKNYVDSLKKIWNETHNIYYKNHPVELYIQDISEENKSQAIYSILKNKWIKKPKYQSPNIDKEAIRKKYKEYTYYVDTAIQEQDLEKLKQLLKRIYDMRQTGLYTGGEYSTENLTFKLLRTNGYLNKIKNNITTLIDKNLSQNIK